MQCLFWNGWCCRADCRSIELPNKESLEDPDNNGYKYLGIWGQTITYTEKWTTRSSMHIFPKLLLELKLNSRNIASTFNIWAVAVVCYGASIKKWIRAEIDQLVRTTEKTTTMQYAHHPKANVHRLYMKRGKGGRGLISIQECINIERR